MTERVFKFDKSEQQQLKQLLAYDPYLDPDLIKKGVSDEDKKKMSAEELAAAEAEEQQTQQKLKALSESKYANIIFVRQKYDMREGSALGLDAGKVYLYISAGDDFLDGAEQLFRERFKTCEHAEQQEQAKFIDTINEEESRANAGFGNLFG